MAEHDDEERLLRSVALQNAKSILQARQRAEEELVQAKEALQRKTEELAHSLAMTRATLESTTDGILATDGKGRITGFNEKFLEIWGAPRSIVVAGDHGKMAKLFSQNFTVPQQFLDRTEEIYASALPESYDLLELADGRVFERFSRTQVVDNQVVGRVWSLRDVTDRKRAEEQLRQSEQRQRETASELRKVAANLSDADRRKNEFLAMLAHELRNPLAPIRNALQIVKLTRGDDDTVRSASEVMERQLAHMVRLVDDLLDVSRITRGKIDLRREPVDLAAIVAQAVETCRAAIDQSHHELTVSLPPEPIVLHADAMRLAQVFANLLNNACKYSEPEGHIWLTARRDGADVLVSVKDAGVGIPADMLPNIFEMFTQIDQSLERTRGGLGIGLTIVQRLVEMHSGSVSASSKGAGQGSEFVVRLPIMTGAPLPAPPAPSKPAAQLPRRILVVDDNRDSATSLAMLLKFAGNEMRVAYDGLAAVEAAADFRPDVMLLDIGLPLLNGYEVARKIREHAWGGRIVLVALTGWGKDEDRERSTAAGFDGHMVKPVDYPALMELLAELQPAAE